MIDFLIGVGGVILLLTGIYFAGLVTILVITTWADAFKTIRRLITNLFRRL